MDQASKTDAPTISNAIGEWFGVRLYPDSQCRAEHLQRFRTKECPYLTVAFERQTPCVKADNSAGVCTITTSNKGQVRDWMVCPYRAIDHSFLVAAVQQLFSVEGVPQVVAAPLLGTDWLAKVTGGPHAEFFVFFQDKLGGEISLQSTPSSPELAFDLTFVRMRSENNRLAILDWAFLELQTMDFHGSYMHAVGALKQALNLFPETFHEEVARNREWLSRRIEGPNLANVFKRTFYQMLVKFSLAGHGGCRGAIMALPSAVWESWRPHLGGITELVAGSDYTFGSGSGGNTWIYLFDFTPSSICIVKRILVSTLALQAAAFEVAPKNLAQLSTARIQKTIAERLKRVNRRLQLA